MTAKNFCYASAGIFLLVAAYTLGARHAVADLNHATGSHVIGFEARSPSGGGLVALRSDGTQWSKASLNDPWTQQDAVGLPPCRSKMSSSGMGNRKMDRLA